MKQNISLVILSIFFAFTMHAQQKEYELVVPNLINPWDLHFYQITRF